MSPVKDPFGARFYRGLLCILPFDFRSEFGSDMEETFRAQREATERRRGNRSRPPTPGHRNLLRRTEF
jgi:hypothetical protein